MATFAFKPQYTYKPTPPRSKSAATRRRPAPKQVNIFDKLQQIRSSSTSLSTPRPAATDGDGGYRPGIRGTGTVHGRSDKANDDENDDDRDLPTVEELLLTKLQEQGFVTENRGPGKTGVVEEVASEERGGSVDQSRSAQSDNSGGSPEDPIGDSSASKAEVNDISLRAESAAAPGVGLFDSPETTFDSTTPAPPCSSDGWHDIDDFPETAPRLPLAEQGVSTSNSIQPHTPSSRHSSEPLHDSISISTEGSRCARSEATTSSSSPPPRHCRASPENQLSQEGRLHTCRGVADEHRLVGPARNADPVDERERRQQQEEEEDEDNDEDTSSKSEHPPSLQGASVRKCRPLCENSAILGMEAIEPPQADVDLLDWEADSMAPMQLKVWSRASADRDTKTLVDDQLEGLHQEVMGVAAEPTAKRVGDTHLSGEVDGSPRPAERQQLLPNREQSPATSHNKAGCDSHSSNELNNTESDKDDEEPRPMKRKRPASSQDGPMPKKPKPRLQQRSTRQRRPHSNPHGRSPKSHSLLDQGSTVAPVSSADGRLPSPPLSAPHAADTDMSPDCCNLDRSSGVALPTLTEVTFRPHSPHCCSFTAVIRDGCAERGVSFNQVVRLIAGIGHVGKVDDFTIKPLEQHSFLVTGFSRHTPSRPSSGGTAVSTAAEAGRTHKDATRTRPKHVKATHAQALASQRSEPSSSDDDSGLSDSDPDLSSDDDGCSSEDEQGLSTGVNDRWDPVDEQRLLAWRKEGKSWKWIFRKFKGRRTLPALRQRPSIVRNRCKKASSRR